MELNMFKNAIYPHPKMDTDPPLPNHSWSLACHFQPSVDDPFALPNKIWKLAHALVKSIQYGSINQKTQRLIYEESGLPKIILQVIPSVHTNADKSLTDVFNQIANDAAAFDTEYFATVLMCAKETQFTKPNHYPLMMSDLSIHDINSKRALITNMRTFGYDVSTLNIYISFDQDTPRYSYSYDVTVTDYGYEDSIAPIQSIKIDSNIDYRLFPNVYLNYTRY